MLKAKLPLWLLVRIIEFTVKGRFMMVSLARSFGERIFSLCKSSTRIHLKPTFTRVRIPRIHGPNQRFQVQQAPTVPADTIIPSQVLLSIKISSGNTWGDNSPSGPQAPVASLQWNNIHKSITFWAGVRLVGKGRSHGLRCIHFKQLLRSSALILINPLDTISVA